MTNRKSHMGFRLTPRSMTLDDLNCCKVEFSHNPYKTPGVAVNIQGALRLILYCRKLQLHTYALWSWPSPFWCQNWSASYTWKRQPRCQFWAFKNFRRILLSCHVRDRMSGGQGRQTDGLMGNTRMSSFTITHTGRGLCVLHLLLENENRSTRKNGET